MRLGRKLDDILSEFEKDVKKAKELRSKGNHFRECIAHISKEMNLGMLSFNISGRQSDRVLGLCLGIMDIIIDEYNAQNIYDWFLHEWQNHGDINGFAVFDVLKWCLDQGALPNASHIYDISYV